MCYRRDRSCTKEFMTSLWDVIGIRCPCRQCSPPDLYVKTSFMCGARLIGMELRQSGGHTGLLINKWASNYWPSGVCKSKKASAVSLFFWPKTRVQAWIWSLLGCYEKSVYLLFSSVKRVSAIPSRSFPQPIPHLKSNDRNVFKNITWPCIALIEKLFLWTESNCRLFFKCFY